ncbi:glycosyltransferase [Rhodovarius crocodyli]|uniref:Glycosyltransferase n=1 Tax=Rhodovarius crocodyli TaxID=1979269 RepID=A0A437MJT5_9PROT|nr:bacteriohopanetetrol glucosamine biosynthesis glycosyltransferase HpnI [Rhodovarius crocodyli]RVT97934.1 glycosyltransferase [Rhodovarius crocodyli]
MLTAVAAFFALLGIAAAVQGMLAARAVSRLAAAQPPGGAPEGPMLAASILKPLYGAEPGLDANIASHLDQAHTAPHELLMAVADPGDAAVPVAARFCPPARLHQGGAVLGANRKVSQLVHLAREAAHPVLAVVDADMRVSARWLTAVTAPLADPSVGLVTCLYRGVPADGGFFSRLTALQVDWHFLPSAALGESLGQAHGCYGATMALRAETLERLGGFEAFLDLLADDHALGVAVRGLGLKVVLADELPAHVMHEAALPGLWRHELRWARTVRLLNPWGYLGLGLTHPLPWALLALVLAPENPWIAGAFGLSLAMRLSATAWIDRALGLAPRPAWVPLRDALSFAVWLAGLWPGRVAWGSERFRIGADGRMKPG